MIGLPEKESTWALFTRVVEIPTLHPPSTRMVACVCSIHVWQGVRVKTFEEQLHANNPILWPWHVGCSQGFMGLDSGSNILSDSAAVKGFRFLCDQPTPFLGFKPTPRSTPGTTFPVQIMRVAPSLLTSLDSLSNLLRDLETGNCAKGPGSNTSDFRNRKSPGLLTLPHTCLADKAIDHGATMLADVVKAAIAQVYLES